jgi:thiamine biosynthesis protein ThiS
MDITLNGDPRSVPEAASVTELLALLGLAPERVAVERNEALVRRAQFDATRLAPGDRVEIVTLVGGG